MKKSLIAILMTTVILLSFLGPIFYIQTAFAALRRDPTTWYKEVNGVLHSDYYTLYPYEKKSIKLGFSKFGELISNNTNVGLEYAGDRDPFAAPAGSSWDPLGKLPKWVWINGWYIELSYVHNAWGNRTLWAGALFADLSSYTGPWLRVDNDYGSCTYEWQEDFRKAGRVLLPNGALNTSDTSLYRGGRKTNGTATTDDIVVLYHGPRKFVAKLVTHIYDWDEVTGGTLHIVDVMLTIIFNKVKKEIIVLKEVKLMGQAKLQINPLPLYITNGTDTDLVSIPYGVLVQFSNREEWDLGKEVPGTTPFSSYAHFYTEGTASNDTETEGQTTVYDGWWTACQTLPTNTTYEGVVVNAYGPEPNSLTGTETYDVAQIISNDKKYVGWHACWPSLSDWSIDGARGPTAADIVWYRAMKAYDPHYIDSYTGSEPWLSPLVVAEWDFALSDVHYVNTGAVTRINVTSDAQFRAVSVYGVTDLNDGEDADMPPYGMYSDIIDKEVCYQLNETFNPWDLCDVQDKSTMRWVTKEWGDDVTCDFWLKYTYMYPGRTIPGWPYVYVDDFINATWDAYCVFAERVLVDGVLQVRDVDYILCEDIDGYIYIEFDTAPPEDALIKILFSTNDIGPYDGSWEWLTVGRDAQPVDIAGALMVSEWTTLWSDAPVKLGSLDMQDEEYGPETPYIFDQQRIGLLPDRTGYRDDTVAYNKGRARLRNDWCSHYAEDVVTEEWEWRNGLPISSSNIIGVGGPYANLAAEYFNDFTDAFFTIPWWTIGATSNVIYPLTCWSAGREDIERIRVHQYVPEYNETTGEQTLGYAVITTYKDINGTVGLLIWGYTGQDTYYACWSLLHSDILWLALEAMRHGVTTLILEFDYTLHPTDYCFVTIVEALGTISEFNFNGYLEDDLILERIDGFWPETWIDEKFPPIHVDP